MFQVLLLSLIGITPTKKDFDFNFSQQHDKGFYLRLEAGLGFANLTTTRNNDDLSKKGFGLTHSISLGWFVEKNLALHLSEFGLLSSETIRQAVGPGLTFYLSDSLFSSVVIGATLGSDHEADLQLSLSGELSLGLMGWISSESQLGISTHIAGETIDLDGDDTVQSGWRVGLRLGVSWH